MRVSGAYPRATGTVNRSAIATLAHENAGVICPGDAASHSAPAMPARLVVRGRAGVRQSRTRRGRRAPRWLARHPLGSSLATVRLSQPLVPRPLTPTPGIVAGPPCYAPAFLHPAAYVLPKGYALDSTTFGVTFCFYDNHLSSVNMLGVATLDNQVRSTLPAELATRYGPPIFSGADLNQSNGQLTRWTTRASDIALNIKDVVVANAQVRSILLLYNSSAFLNEVRQTLARQRQEIR